MRRNQVVAVVLVSLLLGVYACKSVETTSAMLHNQTKQYYKAIHSAKLGLEKNPLDAEAYFQLGYSYTFIEKMDSAYYCFMKSAELDPKRKTDVENNIGSNWARHFNLGVSEYGSANMMGAAKEFEQATQADPRKIKGWLNLAMSYNQIVEEGDSTYMAHLYAASDTLMAKVGSDDPDYGKALSLAGRVMIMKGDEEQAIATFDRLIQDDPTNAEIVEQIGNDFLRAQNYGGAAKMYQLAAQGYRRSGTDNPDLYYNMGVCYLRLKEYMSAADAYQQVIALQPENKTAHYSLILSYYQGEFWDEVIMYAQKYTTEIDPADPRGWQILALTYTKKNMKELAERAMQKFQELSEE